MSESNYFEHTSVLLSEILAFLTGDVNLSEENYFADLTFGGGGHSLAISEKSKKFKLICTDQDSDALENGEKLILAQKKSNQITLLDSNFRNFSDLIKKDFNFIIEKLGGFSGILLDLGVSSHHFDSPQRGFSFRMEGPLDMRMDTRNNQITASDIVNNYFEEELEEILRNYGEERFAKKIAENICIERKSKEILTTKDLEDIVFHSYPKKLRFGKIHPATKTFQALRIEVNDELGVLKEVISRLVELLRPKGKLAIISFHSLEDRIVKHEFRRINKEEGIGQILTKRPIIPTDEEILKNSRSRSAKLRVIEKV